LGPELTKKRFFRSSITKLEYVDAATLVCGSEDSTMRVWSVDTGAQKEDLDGGSFAFSQDSSPAKGSVWDARTVRCCY
jgi:WD40 repeat protein